jgi:hypothetical protein
MGRKSRRKKEARGIRVTCPYCAKEKNVNRIVAMTSEGRVVDAACSECYKGFQQEGFMHPDDCACGACGDKSLIAYDRSEGGRTSTKTDNV